MTFQVQTMIGNEALVSGSDKLGNEGKMVVSTTQWDELKARKNFSAAAEDFDAAVEEFFKPLVEAAEKTKAAMQPAPQDKAAYVVLTEETEAVAGKPAEIVELTRDSIILRLIEEGDTDRLVWLDENSLGIFA